MLKIGLVGDSGVSGAHTPAWDEMKDTELVAICDIRQERMKPYPNKRQYTDFEEMLAKEGFDILDICLPTYLHADYAIKAMERRPRVICEKPISLKKDDVEKVYSTAMKMSEYELIQTKSSAKMNRNPFSAMILQAFSSFFPWSS